MKRNYFLHDSCRSRWCLAFVASLCLFGRDAVAQTAFTNATAITVADGSAGNPGLGNPYPSVITVSGVSGAVTDVNVRLNSFSSTFPGDIDLLLVAPNGTRMVIQSDVAGTTDAVFVTYMFDDQAAALIPASGAIARTSYRPTSYGDDDRFPVSGATPPPADCQPAGECPQAGTAGTATLNGTFGGMDPNGEWKLYAVDDAGGDTATYNGGWTLLIRTDAPPAPIPPGSCGLDPTFDGAGKVTTSFSTGGDIADIALQPDGKIVAVGSGSFGSGTLEMARYNSDGSLDTS
ncbi:MAG TPA: delta-60 repeat domain-containing protein, partial [Methylomirabilota bacterium]|nr:delta-60 repeat domain-containing protein [Methylomirabilota bacterium]